MKKLITILLLLSLTLTPKANASTKRYTLYGTAYNANCVDCGNKFVAVITDDGNEWHMTTNVKVKDGQKVKLRMDTMGTPSIYDDEIVSIKKVKRKTLKEFYDTIPLTTEVEFFDSKGNLILDEYNVQNIGAIVEKYGNTTNYSTSKQGNFIFIDLWAVK